MGSNLVMIFSTNNKKNNILVLGIGRVNRVAVLSRDKTDVLRKGEVNDRERQEDGRKIY